MVRELDMLLDSIEGKGGFKDACILAQKSSVEALEKGIDNLSKQCTMWKVISQAYVGELNDFILDRISFMEAELIWVQGSSSSSIFSNFATYYAVVNEG